MKLLVSLLKPVPFAISSKWEFYPANCVGRKLWIHLWYSYLMPNPAGSSKYMQTWSLSSISTSTTLPGQAILSSCLLTGLPVSALYINQIVSPLCLKPSRIPCDPAYVPKAESRHLSQYLCTSIHSSIFTTIRKGKEPKCQLANEWIHKMWYMIQWNLTHP